MPELPEVEIAARNLRAWTAGRRIVGVEADPKARYVFRPSTPATFARKLEGARFGKIRRIGKQLLVTLEKDGAPLGLLAHLGMTGKWLRRAPHDPPPRFSRARFALDDGAVLHFADMRLFGRLRLVPGARFEEVPEVAALGPDPLEAGIDRTRLAEALARSRLPVKVRIMDQAILPGVGNIQASRGPLPREDRSAAARLLARRARGEGRRRRGARVGEGEHRARGGAGDLLRRGAGVGEPVPRLRARGGAVPALQARGDPARGAGAALHVLLPALPEVTDLP